MSVQKSENSPTRVKVSGEIADQLNDRKGNGDKPSRKESYEDVIRRLLGATEGDR